MATHQGERNDLNTAIDVFTKSGYSLKAVAEACPAVFVRNHRGLQALGAQLNGQVRTAKTKILWLYGPTGVGKSLTAFSLRQAGIQTFYKDCRSAWWDGYMPQMKLCVLDDYRPDMCTFSHLLNLFDGYPLNLQIKGGYQQCLLKWIVVTTPKSPAETWANQTEERIAQLTRRVEHVFQMPMNALEQMRLTDVIELIKIDCSDPSDIPLTQAAPEDGQTSPGRSPFLDPLPSPRRATEEEEPSASFLRRQPRAMERTSSTSSIAPGEVFVPSEEDAALLDFVWDENDRLDLDAMIARV